ncbi:hypothetical protein [Mesorhizobium neociceri]|uniref:Uncharacterized protein n=1 Tax=Mesorhizobium neociceri TaxID=1307853 RepID=A0A838B9B2_9HYPH|nr:hypothetical protein [Mesorhizobium neociceri]MBA1143196.1 hypothetical protein [Mesorhizobium neociceri]
MPIDLPPVSRLWLPPQPAIIRCASDIKRAALPGFAPLPASQSKSLRSMVTSVGLLPNLQLCLDPGAATSWPQGSTQTLKDISGNGRDFYLGSGSGSDAADPAFNGTIGSEDANTYFSSDGGDGLTKASANDSWFNGLHIASAAWSIVFVEYFTSAYGPTLVTQSGAFASNNTAVGISVYTTANRPGFTIGNGSASVGTNVLTSGSPMATNTMLMVGVGYTHTSNTSRTFVGYVNGTYETNTYTSPSWTPSTSNASATATMGISWGSGRRFYGFVMFNKMLSQAEFDALRLALKRRFTTI